ncbi:MAG: hypothetical protein CSA62_14050 [Planctomycetota bacterium]|nr:MAG: hypothetical protein CSA62_14050 [Planctomycetota bacterium]
MSSKDHESQDFEEREDGFDDELFEIEDNLFEGAAEGDENSDPPASFDDFDDEFFLLEDEESSPSGESDIVAEDAFDLLSEDSEQPEDMGEIESFGEVEDFEEIDGFEASEGPGDIEEPEEPEEPGAIEDSEFQAASEEPEEPGEASDSGELFGSGEEAGEEGFLHFEEDLDFEGDPAGKGSGEFGGSGTMPHVEELLFGNQPESSEELSDDFDKLESFEVEDTPFDVDGQGWEGEENFQAESLGLEQSEKQSDQAEADSDSWEQDSVFGGVSEAISTSGAEDFLLLEGHGAGPVDEEPAPLFEPEDEPGSGLEITGNSVWDQEDEGAEEVGDLEEEEYAPQGGYDVSSDYDDVSEEEDLESSAELFAGLGGSGPGSQPLGQIEASEEEEDLYAGMQEEDEGYEINGSLPDPSDFEVQDQGFDEEDVDPIYGEPMDGSASLNNSGYGSGDSEDALGYRESERLYVDGQDPSVLPGTEPVVIGTARRGSWTRRFMVLGMAASVLVLGSIGFLTARPDLPFSKKLRETIGLKPPQTHEITVSQVQRPKVDTSYAMPSVEGQVAARTGKKPGMLPLRGGPGSLNGYLAKDPKLQLLRLGVTIASKITENAAKKLAEAEKREPMDPIASRPEESHRPEKQPPLTPPVVGQPVAQQPVAQQPETQQPGAQPEKERRAEAEARAKTPVEQSGEKLAQAGKSKSEKKLPLDPQLPESKAPSQAGRGEVVSQSKLPAAVPSEQPRGYVGRRFDQSILRGTQAIAQLRNGNFFVGRIHKITAVEVTLRLKEGELTLYPDQVNTLTPISDTVAKRIENSPEGWVKLRNRETIRGRIVENSAELLTIQKGGAKIVIPRKAILEVRERADPKYRLTPDDEEDWLSEDNLPRPEPADELPKVEKTLPKGAIRVDLGVPAAPKK